MKKKEQKPVEDPKPTPEEAAAARKWVLDHLDDEWYRNNKRRKKK